MCLQYKCNLRGFIDLHCPLLQYPMSLRNSTTHYTSVASSTTPVPNTVLLSSYSRFPFCLPHSLPVLSGFRHRTFTLWRASDQLSIGFNKSALGRKHRAAGRQALAHVGNTRRRTGRNPVASERRRRQVRNNPRSPNPYKLLPERLGNMGGMLTSFSWWSVGNTRGYCLQLRRVTLWSAAWCPLRWIILSIIHGYYRLPLFQDITYRCMSWERVTAGWLQQVHISRSIATLLLAGHRSVAWIR